MYLAIAIAPTGKNGSLTLCNGCENSDGNSTRSHALPRGPRAWTRPSARGRDVAFAQERASGFLYEACTQERAWRGAVRGNGDRRRVPYASSIPDFRHEQADAGTPVGTAGEVTRETGLISGIPVAKDDVREELVREELDRILEFDGIRNSAMLASFLRYVVEETLAGRAERLKAYTIAVEALNRAEDFDPNESALVRVNARRLRDVLSRYYSIPQNDRGFRIELPPGGYVPPVREVRTGSRFRAGPGASGAGRAR